MPPDRYYLVVRYVYQSDKCWVYHEIFITTEDVGDVVSRFRLLGDDTRLILVEEVGSRPYILHVETFGGRGPFTAGKSDQFTREIVMRPSKHAALTIHAIKSIRLEFRQQQ